MLKKTAYTRTISAKTLKPKLVVVDARDQVLGRLATKIVHVLLGKNRVDFSTNLVMGDVVVVTNASLVRVTGRKETQKMYGNYSGYPGGLRQENYASLHARRPQEIIRHAVSGMLPDNKLRDVFLSRLLVFPADTYTVPPKMLEITKEINATPKK